MKKGICLLFLLSFLLPVKAQEMWGISNSNFSGNMGIFLNPSTIVGAPYQYEINIIALDAFAENTFLYFPKDEHIIPRTIFGNTTPGKKYLYSGTGLQSAYAHGLVIGPSYIRNKTTWAWGIHSALRSEFSISNFPAELGLLFYDDFHSDSLYGMRIGVPPFSSAGASWIELGGTYGKLFKESEYHQIKWAATANLLIGMNGFYFDEQSAEFTSIDSTQLVLHNLDGTIANAGNSFFGFRGLGLSTTLGVTYINHPNRGAFECTMANDKIRKYKYRLGFSMIDLGLLRFFNETSVYHVNVASDRIWNGIDTVHFGSIDALTDLLESNIGGTTTDDNFTTWLPLAISAQFDYQIKPNLFANASVVNRIHFSKNQIARGNQANLSVRYERRRYEGAINFTMFEYKQPSLGLGLRYRFFVIGTDRLLQMLGLSDVKAFDFFFGIKFQFCKRPFSPGPDCPAFLSN